MVLQHVANGAGLVVERAAILHPEILGHGDLNATHMGAIPDRFIDRVGKARVEDVLHRLLAEIVVDAEDIVFGEIMIEDAAQRGRRFAVAAERLLHHEPRILGAARFGELRRHLGEQRRWDGEIVQGALGIAHLLAQLREHIRIGIVAVHVAQLAQELLEGIGVDVAAMRLDAVGRALLELVEAPAGLGHADNGCG